MSGHLICIHRLWEEGGREGERGRGGGRKGGGEGDGGREGGRKGGGSEGGRMGGGGRVRGREGNKNGELFSAMKIHMHKYVFVLLYTQVHV